MELPAGTTLYTAATVLHGAFFKSHVLKKLSKNYENEQRLPKGPNNVISLTDVKRLRVRDEPVTTQKSKLINNDAAK